MTVQGLLCVVLLVSACGAPTGSGSGSGSGSASDSESASESTLAIPPFTLRGRWDDPRDITWRAEPSFGDASIAALEQAAAVWNTTGVVTLRPAREGETADVTFGWRRAAHDECPAFGSSPSVAHSGPVAPGTFVHFDAGRPWAPSGEADDSRATPARTPESLTQVAAHEWGHVLGLGHVDDPSSLMSPDARVIRPAAGDLAGLHSLYGGGVEGPGDVRLISTTGSCTLRRVAPSDRTLAGLFDTDGDGTHELLVLRTDPRGLGALMIYRFGPGPVPVGSDGPWLGIAPPGTRTLFAVDPAGTRWIVTRTGDGVVVRLRSFDDTGRLAEPSPQEVMALDIDALTDAWVRKGDVDGDGVAERVSSS